MPPRYSARGGRAAPASYAAPGRQSTRIAAQMGAAQQAAGQPAPEEPASEPEPVVTAAAAAAAADDDDDAAHDTDASLNASPGDNDDDKNNVDDDDAAPPESSMPPPSSGAGPGTGRAPGEQYARRATRRVPRATMPASVQSAHSTGTSASLPATQSDARGEHELLHGFPRAHLLTISRRTHDAAPGELGCHI